MTSLGDLAAKSDLKISIYHHRNQGIPDLFLDIRDAPADNVAVSGCRCGRLDTLYIGHVDVVRVADLRVVENPFVI